MKEERAYPYTAWVLLPSFRLKQVEIVRPYYGEWQESASGKTYSNFELYASKEAAIAGGWERVHKQEADLSKKQASLYKKRTALEKAA